ncbi:MAG: translocation/assembly module TamB [Verrucomicrobiota bacterium]|nr:translocation/assembly module TamB [Verrucomicrobiota bacterium]
MDEDGSSRVPASRSWLKTAGIALGILALLLLVFHRPILHAVVRRVAIHFAAKEHLKLDLRVEGSVLGGVMLRNVHAVATGPSALQSLDADSLRVDYSLLGLLRHGMSEFLQNIELRNASVVLDQTKAPPLAPPKEKEKFTLPAFFPDRLTLSDVNVRMASQPADLIVQHLYLELLPDKPGGLRIAKLQIPSGKNWTGVTAQTTYQNRNLFLRNLVLDDQTQLAEVNIDASKIGENKLSVGVNGTVAGGKIDTTISLGAKDGSAQTNIDLNVENTSLDSVRKYLQPAEAAKKRDATDVVAGAAVAAAGGEPKPRAGDAAALIPTGIDGDVKKLSIKLSGQADRPSSWNGTVSAQIENLGAGGGIFDHATIDVKAAGGQAQINSVELSRGANSITLQGTAELPDTFAGFGHKPATIQLRGNLPELGQITAGLPKPITGSAEINGQVKVADDIVHADIVLAGGPIDFGGEATAQKFVVKLNAAKKMPPPNEQKPYFDGLTSTVGFDLSEVRAKDYVIDTVHGQMQSAGQELTVQQLLVSRAQNQLTLSGRYQLPEDFSRGNLQPGEVEISMNAPQLADFWAAGLTPLVNGPLMIDGQVTTKEGAAEGAISVYSTNLRSHDLVVPELSAQIAVWKNVVYLNDFTANLNEHDFIRASGTASLEKPYRYTGSLAVDIAELARFKPILAAAGNKNELAGALAIEWHGRGQAGTLNNSGDMKFTLEKGRYAKLLALQARVEATYAPDGLTAPIVYFGSDKMFFQAVAESNGNTLEISNIQIDQGKAKYATGYVSIPFVWKNLGSSRPMFEMNAPVAVTLQSENLDLKKLFDDLGAPPVGSGLVSMKVDAKGTLANLDAQVDLQMRDLRSAKLPNFDPASVDLTAHVQNNQLAVTGKLQQSRLAPVTLDAKMPLNVAQIIETKKFDEATPVSAKLLMPRCSVNFVRQFIPALEQLDGDVVLDVDVNGTVANPVLSGAGDMTINLARFSNPTLPALRGFKAHLAFARDTLTLERFGGELAGGPFTVSGRLTFPKLTEPTFDVQLKAKSVLVARNDNVTARADADIRIAGPFASANVTGNVALTNSQFLKNIDLIPIGLPGRPPPRPKPPASQDEFSFPQPPLRDWKFDVKVTTKDPFLIRGNLAHGEAIVQLHLGGTGLHPGLEGNVRLENVEATLPFSRLEIAQGFLYFDPGDSLNPKMDLQGTSLIRDYTIHVYVYGTVNAPEAVFTSEPPLPQEEIISLLATGTTREELLGGNNVLAGRAAMLLVQQLYRKVFKKGEATKSNSVFDRLQLDIGNVDPRTGQQTATARYKVNDRFVLIGDLGVGGDFRGIVKYLVRFK